MLRAGNNQVIGKSEMYSSDKALANGMDSVKKNAPDAAVDDQTKIVALCKGKGRIYP